MFRCITGTEAGHSKEVLLKLLKPGGALADKKAVVVYTTFQVQAEQVAAHLHSHGIPAAAYHAGKHFKVWCSAVCGSLHANFQHSLVH